mmetsp:Transcript_34219/g.94324  ORF Transcript_34219/g.94324 Transcript_34219/m.94324 type:complete len:88 (+) Transcript_34219:435-698(+)|eukprot:CAMPEP_0117461026 /NCGR_PEP_ID=MMETSP0784-20121206/2312_1 /TAXON_ID=39447 /ORGANISM="" /LENGTH=87 /DNA_ID=CAMNT_0005254719 /DNA_START=947 /DNA_END=1210 /DNA_ORIENTATION=+
MSRATQPNGGVPVAFLVMQVMEDSGYYADLKWDVCNHMECQAFSLRYIAQRRKTHQRGGDKRNTLIQADAALAAARCVRSPKANQEL